MILYAALTTFGTIAALIYLAFKIGADAKARRFGWVALGSFALAGIAAQFLPAMFMLAAMLFTQRSY